MITRVALSRTISAPIQRGIALKNVFSHCVKCNKKALVTITPQGSGKVVFPFALIDYHYPFYRIQYSTSSAGEESLKIELLNKALELVNEHGWTMEALNQAAKQMNLSVMAVSQLLDSAQYDLIEYFIIKCNQQMSKHVQLMDTSKMDTCAIIKYAIKMRLEMVGPYVRNGTWSEAMSSFLFGKHPLDVFSQIFNYLTSTTSRGESPNVTGFNAVYHLATLADEICFLAGIKDTDINWYTKRAVIAAIYASTEFFMLTDNSEDFADTWRFLDNRLDEALTLKRYVDSFVNDVKFWVKGFETFWGLKEQPSFYLKDNTQEKQPKNL